MVTAVDGWDAYQRHAYASSQETPTKNPRVVKEKILFGLRLGDDSGGDDENDDDEME